MEQSLCNRMGFDSTIISAISTIAMAILITPGLTSKGKEAGRERSEREEESSPSTDF